MANKNNHHDVGGRRIHLSWIVAAAIVIIVVVYVSLHKHKVNIRAERVQRQDLISSISTNGKVEPVQNFEAHAPAAVSVLQVLVKEGDHVRKGQLLVRLDDADARAAAARAQAQIKAAQAESAAIQAGGTREEVSSNQNALAKARDEQNAALRNLAAYQKLQQSGAASAGEVQEAQNRLDRANADLRFAQQRVTSRFAPQDIQRTTAAVGEAEAAYAAAEDQLHKSNITAPFDGVVYSVPVRTGNFVSAGDLIVQVANLDHMQVRAFVDEPEIGRLRIGEPVTIRWDALPNQTWTGSVTTVPETVTMRGTRNVGEVLCSIHNGDNKLLPNTNVTVGIETARRNNVLTIPREAVHQDASGKYALVVRDGRLERVPIETGIASLTRSEIVSGLNEGEVIAINSLNAEPLAPGQRVNVIR